MDWIIIASMVLVATLVFFNVAATVTIARSALFEPVQKWAQGILVWLVPFIGAFLIVHIISGHEPNAVPRKALAWSGVGWGLLSVTRTWANPDGASAFDHGIDIGAGDGGGGDGGGGGAP